MEFHLVQSETEFDALAGEWNQLLEESENQAPFLRHEYQRIWWQNRGGGEWPDARLSVVTAREDGRLAGVAPLFYTEAHATSPALMLLGSIEVSDYLDLIARRQALPAFIEGLLDYLPTAGLPEWKSLDCYNILDSSSTLPLLEEGARRRGWAYQVEKEQHCPYIQLPADWETYLSQVDKKQRHEIRRKIRRLEDSGTASRWYIVDEPEQLAAETEAFLELMAKDPQKEAFLTAPMRAMFKETIQCAFEEHCLQLAFLEIGGVKAAGYLSFDYLNRLWVYNSGLDRSLLDYSPGWVLLAYLLRWANENGRREFDFLRGDEDYKYRFGAVDRFVVRALVTRQTAQ